MNVNLCFVGSSKGGEANAERYKQARAAAVAGQFEDIPADIYIKHYRNLKNIHKDSMKRPADLESGVRMKWYWGRTGRGKTHAAYNEYPEAYRKIASNKWWDGYQGEDVVILDDLDIKHDYMVYYLKIWADRYAFMVETKGSASYARPKLIVVCSNYHPREIWTNESDLDPILRRFEVTEFKFTDDRSSTYASDCVRTRDRECAPTRLPPPPPPAGVFGSSVAGFSFPASGALSTPLPDLVPGPDLDWLNNVIDE